MPVDEHLRDSPLVDMQAGPSRTNGDASTRTRLKPRRSAESDVFDEIQARGSIGPSSNDAVKRTTTGKRESTTKSGPASKTYLAPASSQPDEEFVQDKSLAALERAMEEAIDEDSEAEGQPDTDDGELEQDLLQHIARQERPADRGNGEPKFAFQASRRTISPPTVSQVPDTQAPERGQARGSSEGRTRNQDNKFRYATTGRVLLDSVKVPALPIKVAGTSTRIDSSTIGHAGTSAQVVAARTTSEVILQTATVPKPSAGAGPSVAAAALEQRQTSDPQPNSGRNQTEQEKREELKRIVVGLVQEYDLNYKAMHRLIEECRKRYNYVNQALLRGMIEQALANAQE